MTGQKILPVILALGLAVAACDDDDAGTPTGPQASVLYGSWEVMSNQPLVADDDAAALQAPSSISDEARFIHLRADHTYDLLEATANGFRSIERGVFLVSGGQVNLGEGIYNYSVQENALTLSHPEQTIIAIRTENAPAGSEWIAPMTSLASMVAPADDDADLTWDGSHLWFGNGYSSDELYRIDPEQLAVVSTLPTTRSAWGLCWHDGSLWCSDDGSDNIYELDPATGLTLSTSPDMGNWIPGIASDGQNLWCVSDNADTIYEYDASGNIVASTIELDPPFSPGGAVFVDGFLYFSNYGVVHRCTVNPFEVQAAYALEDRYVEGITFDGTSFWVVTGSQAGYRIHKVDF
jgi:hypothetical protein